MGPASGSKPTSYRAKAYGMLSLLRFLIRIKEYTSMHFHWNGVIATDSQSLLDTLNAVDELEQQQDNLPTNLNGGRVVLDVLTPDWDVLIEIQRSSMEQLPQEIWLEYMKGHQDTSRNKAGRHERAPRSRYTLRTIESNGTIECRRRCKSRPISGRVWRRTTNCKNYDHQHRCTPCRPGRNNHITLPKSNSIPSHRSTPPKLSNEHVPVDSGSFRRHYWSPMAQHYEKWASDAYITRRWYSTYYRRIVSRTNTTKATEHVQHATTQWRTATTFFDALTLMQLHGERSSEQIWPTSIAEHRQHRNWIDCWPRHSTNGFTPPQTTYRLIQFRSLTSFAIWSSSRTLLDGGRYSVGFLVKNGALHHNTGNTTCNKYFTFTYTWHCRMYMYHLNCADTNFITCTML